MHFLLLFAQATALLILLSQAKGIFGINISNPTTIQVFIAQCFILLNNIIDIHVIYVIYLTGGIPAYSTIITTYKNPYFFVWSGWYSSSRRGTRLSTTQ